MSRYFLKDFSNDDVENEGGFSPIILIGVGLRLIFARVVLNDISFRPEFTTPVTSFNRGNDNFLLHDI